MNDAAIIRSGPERELRDLRALLSKVAARADEAEHDPRGLAPEIELLEIDGLLSGCLPLAFGGQGWADRPAAVPEIFDLLRALGAANLSVGRLFEGHLNAVKLLALYGTSSQKERWFGHVQHGGLLGVWGADGARPLRFQEQGGQIHLDGEKAFASGLGLVRAAIVSARAIGREEDGVQLAVVEVTDRARQDPGAWAATAMRATLSGRFDFTGMRLGRAALLGHPGDYEREPFFEGGVWRYCAVHLGGVDALIDLWRDMLRKRGRQDDPFQIARFARAQGLVCGAACFLQDAARGVEGAHHGDRAAIRRATAQVLLARQLTEETCIQILALAEKSLGTAAHMSGTLERVRRDLSLFIRQAAPDEKLVKAGRVLLDQTDSAVW